MDVRRGESLRCDVKWKSVSSEFKIKCFCEFVFASLFFGCLLGGILRFSTNFFAFFLSFRPRLICNILAERIMQMFELFALFGQFYFSRAGLSVGGISWRFSCDVFLFCGKSTNGSQPLRSSAWVGVWDGSESCGRIRLSA